MASQNKSAKTYGNLQAGQIADPDLMRQYLIDSAGLVQVSETDTHVKRLDDALVAGTGIVKTKLGSAADETLQLAVDSAGLRLAEQAAAPATPATGFAQLYVDTTPALKFKDDAGTVRTLSDTTHVHAAADITSGTLTHERGGLEADVSAYNGLLKISGGATSQAVGGTDYANATHTHAASAITSGTLDNARVNWASPSAIGETTASTLRGTTLALTSTNNVLSALIPNADNTLDLGSATNRWNDVYAGVGRFNEITQPVDVITTITGSYERNILSSTYTPSADSIAFISSTRFNTTISNAFNHNTNGVNGVYSTLTHSGVGTTTTARNLYAISTFSAGTVSGFGISVNNIASGSTMSANRGLYVLMSTTGGAVTTSRGIEVGRITTGGTISETNGIYIGNMGSSLSTTTRALLIDDQTGSSTNQSLVTLGGDVVFNESGTTSIFRVESDTNANMVYVDGTNNRVGIGTSSPTRTFEVNGTLGSLTTYSTTVGATNRALYVDNTGLIGYLSSRAGMKNSVVSLSTTYDTLMQQFEALNPVSFYYNNDLSGQRRFGLIAEEVDAINPHWVSYDPVLALNEETGEMYDTGELVPATVSYNDMISVLIAVVQQLNERIKVLEGA